MSINLGLGYTPLILEKCRKFHLLRNQAAYVLATALWETNRTMKPVVEAYWLSEEWRRKNLRYYPWYGRGFVQLTWRDNYVKAGKALKVDMTTDPAAALDPEISASVLVLGMLDGWFTGKRLDDYVTLSKSNYIRARRIVNGTDKATEIAKLATEYEAALLADGYGVDQGPIKKIPIDLPDVDSFEPAPIKKPRSFWADLFAALAAMFGKAK